MTGLQSTLADESLSCIRRVPVPDWGPLDGAPSAPGPQNAGPPHAGAGQATAPGGGRPLSLIATAGLADAGTDWPHRFARVLVETLAGCRPARHVLPWTSQRARSQFHRLLPGFGPAAASAGRTVPRTGGVPGSGQPRLMRVVATQPAADVIEMSVIAGFGARVRALALRLERPCGQDRAHQASSGRPPWPDAVMAASSGWVCTDIEAA